MKNEESPGATEARWVMIVTIGTLGLLLAYNLIGFTAERSGEASFRSLPPPAHRTGYASFVSSLRSGKYDFRLYEALRRHFAGADLIGYDHNAVNFGGYDQMSEKFGRRTFAGFRNEIVTAYDPALSAAETRRLRQLAVDVLPATGSLPAAVVVAPKEAGRSSSRVLVLRGVDGSRFYVAGPMAPSRYAEIAHGN